MKRLYISTAILFFIIALGLLSIYLIAEQNERLYGKIDAVIEKYRSGEDVTASIADLDGAYKRYRRLVGSLSDDSEVYEIGVSISKLQAMYESGSDEFLAECYVIRTLAREIFQRQRPSFERLL